MVRAQIAGQGAGGGLLLTFAEKIEADIGPILQQGRGAQHGGHAVERNIGPVVDDADMVGGRRQVGPGAVEAVIDAQRDKGKARPSEAVLFAVIVAVLGRIDHEQVGQGEAALFQPEEQPAGQRALRVRPRSSAMRCSDMSTSSASGRRRRRLSSRPR